MEDELYHYGILGQKWGVRRYQNPDGSLTEAGKKRYNKDRDIKTHIRETNLSSWGKDRDHNLLAITGPSGSGKTTLAVHLAEEKGADLINMDAYWDSPNAEGRSKKFDNYLDKHVPDFKMLMDNFERYDKSRFGREGSNNKDQKEYWRIMDNVRDALFEYAKESYPTPVIAEGIQWSDTILFTDNDEAGKQRMAGMPFIVVETPALLSTIRRTIRDNDRVTVQNVLQAVGAYKWNKELVKKALEKEEWVKQQL